LHQYEKSVEIAPVLRLLKKKEVLEEPVKGRQGEGSAMPLHGRHVSACGANLESMPVIGRNPGAGTAGGYARRSQNRIGCRFVARAIVRGREFFPGNT
jgi:hypothetical protein